MVDVFFLALLGFFILLSQCHTRREQMQNLRYKRAASDSLFPESLRSFPPTPIRVLSNFPANY